MKETIKGDVSLKGADECCRIAESMMEEIRLLTIHEKKDQSSCARRHKGSLKRMLMRQIHQARKIAMV
ncbi:MAG: hypothetical protein A4E48_01820 [Methanosaeta sp. PtaU1.Bin060]|jgi:hypothetical protein|nr:MAG: hypothetical protein A4E48_01820 [Methanosaeta sp. PtaU1.Bin060]